MFTHSSSYLPNVLSFVKFGVNGGILGAELPASQYLFYMICPFAVYCL